MAVPFGALRFLYVGSSDVTRDVAFFVAAGAEKLWHHHAFGTQVAAVRNGPGPLWLVAGHRPAPSVLPIYEVDDLKETVKDLRKAGWKPEGPVVEIPNGPCRLYKDPSGNEIALFEETRPGAMSD